MRYAVRMDVRAVIDLSDEVVDEDRDHLLEVHELLEIAEEIDCGDPEDAIYRKMKFDLCPTCFRKFIRNPIGHEPTTEFNFSEN